jgi:hypothetical protein
LGAKLSQDLSTAVTLVSGTLGVPAEWNTNEEYPAMEKDKEKNVKSGQQGSKEPWKKPEKSDHHPTKDSPNPRPRCPKDNETS